MVSPFGGWSGGRTLRLVRCDPTQLSSSEGRGASEIALILGLP